MPTTTQSTAPMPDTPATSTQAAPPTVGLPPAWDGMDCAAHLRSGDITPLEAVDAVIARIEALPRLNAVVLREFDAARDAARAMSALGRAAREQATAQAPLWGVPFVVKDLNQYVQGTVTTHGCRFFEGAVARSDSTLVQRYKAAGLNLLGKTTSPEFGQTPTTESALYGNTPNPWSAQHSAGGSSGGAAAVVAAGILPVAHASDGGGSIRIPAAHCGLLGLKPSRGRLPLGPTNIEGWMGLTMHHVISRSVRDTAHWLDVSEGPEPGSRVMPPRDVLGSYVHALRQPERGLRVAAWRGNHFGVPVHPECVAAQDRAMALCEALGHHVQEVPLAQLPIEAMFASLGVVTAVGMADTVAAHEKQLGRAVREQELEPLNWQALQRSRSFSAAQMYAARGDFEAAGRCMDAFFAQFDVLITPVTAAPPSLRGALSLSQSPETFMQAAMLYAPYTAIFNITGQPAMSVPLHWTAQGLPVGVQFAAGFGGEGRLLRLAAQLEQAAPWAQRRPDVSVFHA